MRRPLIAGNWKMNGSPASVKALLTEIASGAAKVPDVDFAVFPAFPFLSQAQQTLQNTPVAWGAQNMSEFEAGAYTGEVSVQMLNDFGCAYVLVGHSERRHVFGETNEQVAAKCLLACAAGITPIVCVGETLDEREQDVTLEVINRQLDPILALKNVEKMIIAYEPVWAIGTGKTATPEQAQAVHQAIRKRLELADSLLASKMRILYGGSVKSANAEALFNEPDIDGALVGGASLKGDEFLTIGSTCSK